MMRGKWRVIRENQRGGMLLMGKVVDLNLIEGEIETKDVPIVIESIDITSTSQPSI
jgi:hypothetical protein